MLYSFSQVTELLNSDLAISGNAPISATTLKNRWLGGNSTILSKLPSSLSELMKVNGKVTELGLTITRSYLAVSTGEVSTEVWMKSIALTYPKHYATAEEFYESYQAEMVDDLSPTSYSSSELMVVEPMPAYQVDALEVYQNPFAETNYSTHQSNLSVSQTIANAQNFNSDMAAFIKSKTDNLGAQMGAYISGEIIAKAEQVKQQNLGEYLKNTL